MACRDIYCEETSPHLNIWSFSAKMLNHSGPCHFSPKVVFIWFFTIFAPTPPFKGRWGLRIHLMACKDICCEETSPFKYLKYFSQNAEPLRPLPFLPKSGVFFNFLQYFPLHHFQRQMGVRIHLMACRDIFCEETSPFKYLKFFSQNAEPLGPYHFGPKVVFIWFFTIFAPTPLSKANEGLQYVDLMACRDFHCEETKTI